MPSVVQILYEARHNAKGRLRSAEADIEDFNEKVEGRQRVVAREAKQIEEIEAALSGFGYDFAVEDKRQEDRLNQSQAIGLVQRSPLSA